MRFHRDEFPFFYSAAPLGATAIERCLEKARGISLCFLLSGEALNASLGWMCSLMLSFISASRMPISQNHQEKNKNKPYTKSIGTIGGLTKAKGLPCAKTLHRYFLHGSKYIIKLMGKDFRDRF